jgi:hypothetical protein
LEGRFQAARYVEEHLKGDFNRAEGNVEDEPENLGDDFHGGGILSDQGRSGGCGPRWLCHLFFNSHATGQK